MGVILSRIRKKKSTIETLEKLDNDIKEIEESRTNAQKKYKKITKLLLVYSVALYFLCGIIFYFQYNSTLQGKLLYLVPLAISPLLLYIVKKIISWYYNRLINKNQIRLNEMKKEKKRILDEVMDKETYKVAKQILEKFSSETAPKPNLNMQLASAKQLDDGLRKRMGNVPNLTKAQPGSALRGFTQGYSPRPMMSSQSPGRALQAAGASMLRFPAPILPLERGYMDRVVEYLIGDGPNNRYALICSRCHSHNGMALKEEFEYIGFKCCYCYNYNPARKIRPEAPKLESPLKLKRESDTESETRSSGDNSDAETKNQTDLGHESGEGEASNQVERNGSSKANGAVESDALESVENEKSDKAPGEEENAPSGATGAEIDEGDSPTENSTANQNGSNQAENSANCDQSQIQS